VAGALGFVGAAPAAGIAGVITPPRMTTPVNTPTAHDREVLPVQCVLSTG
jgi:hypothetical protein